MKTKEMQMHYVLSYIRNHVPCQHDNLVGHINTQAAKDAVEVNVDHLLEELLVFRKIGVLEYAATESDLNSRVKKLYFPEGTLICTKNMRPL